MRRRSRGDAKSITDIAEHEGMTVAYICRLLPLNCLGADIVEAILDGRQPNALRCWGTGPWAGMSSERVGVWVPTIRVRRSYSAGAAGS